MPFPDIQHTQDSIVEETQLYRYSREYEVDKNWVMSTGLDWSPLGYICSINLAPFYTKDVRQTFAMEESSITMDIDLYDDQMARMLQEHSFRLKELMFSNSTPRK